MTPMTHAHLSDSRDSGPTTQSAICGRLIIDGDYRRLGLGLGRTGVLTVLSRANFGGISESATPRLITHLKGSGQPADRTGQRPFYFSGARGGPGGIPCRARGVSLSLATAAVITFLQSSAGACPSRQLPLSLFYKSSAGACPSRQRP